MEHVVAAVGCFWMRAGITETTERLWHKHRPVRPLACNLHRTIVMLMCFVLNML